MQEFKQTIYPEYVTLFPKSELKPYEMLEKMFQKNIMKFIKIMDSDTFVGFFIVNALQQSHYLHLDFFAILPQYQSKGYGSKALKLLQEESKQFEGIFIEIEKVGEGKNEQENTIRKKRAQFYERVGFTPLKFEIDLFHVLLSAYVLFAQEKIEEHRIVKEISTLYDTIYGENIAKKYVKIFFPNNAKKDRENDVSGNHRKM